MRNIRFFFLIFFFFLVVKFSDYLNRRVFVMDDSDKPEYLPNLCSLCRVFAIRIKKTLVLSFHWVHSEYWSDGRMAKLICVLARRTCHFGGFVIRWLNYNVGTLSMLHRLGNVMTSNAHLNIVCSENVVVEDEFIMLPAKLQWFEQLRDHRTLL